MSEIDEPMPYDINLKNEYTLCDAFQTLGVWLYGPQWTGHEISGRKEEDPAPILEKRKPLEVKVDELSKQIVAKKKEKQNVLGRSEINRVNDDLSMLSEERSDLCHKLNNIGEVHHSRITDHEQWKRFDYTVGVLLRAFANGDLTVYSPLGLQVPDRLWSDFPDGFDYNLECSLIFWPSSECARKMTSARIRQELFDDWLETIPPVVPHELNKLTPEQRAYIWFRDQIPDWDGRTTRDQFKEIMMNDFPGLSGHGFKRIWDALATDDMKRPGARKAV